MMMAKTESHKRAQNKAAGKRGRTEVPQQGGTRLDAMSAGGRATEVERSGSSQGLEKAARRLQKAKRAGASQAVMQVPQKDMDAAGAAMRKVGVSGTVKNMSGTKRRSV
jgi:hypothetical protein